MDGVLDRLPVRRGLIGLSMRLGRGGFSGEVCCHWSRDLSVRDFRGGGEERRLVMATGEVCCHWSPGSGRILPLGTFSPVGGRGGVAHHGSRGLALQYPYLNI